MAKAGRPKKGSAGLPDWFNIENYSGVKNLKTLGWYQQLSARFLMNALRIHNPFGEKQLDTLCEMIKQNPILTTERLMEAIEKCQNKNNDSYKLKSLYLMAYVGFNRQACGVVDATNLDIFAAYNCFPEKIKDCLSKDSLRRIASAYTVIMASQGPMIEMTDVDEFLKNNHNDFFDAQWPLAGCLVSKINILLPEEVLMREFEAYVREKKKKHSKDTVPFFKNPGFKDWYNNGFLPYLDLLLLDKDGSGSIRWPAFADALNQITDVPVSSDSALAKANKANILKLLNPITLQMLSVQAAREESGALKKSGKFLVR